MIRITIVFLLCTLIACKKAENRACVKFNGNTTEKSIQLDHFNKLYVGPYLDFVLVQDSLDYVRLEGGENVLNFVKLEILEKELRITNENKCRFLRNGKKHIVVEIHFTKMDELFFEGSGTLTNKGILNLPYVEITLNEGSGTVNLNVQSQTIRVSAEPSWANYILSGHCTNAELTVKGNSYGDTRGLQVDDLLTIKSRSSADLYVNGNNTGVLKCESWGSGNVFYTGTPLWINNNNYGEGRLLQSN
jgi:hypothetical protein